MPAPICSSRPHADADGEPGLKRGSQREDPLRRQRDDRHPDAFAGTAGPRLSSSRSVSASREYALVTLHRPSNVDSAEDLAECRGDPRATGRAYRIVFPVHPRTRARLEAVGLGRATRANAVFHLGSPGRVPRLSAASLRRPDRPDRLGRNPRGDDRSGRLLPDTATNTERPMTITRGNQPACRTRSGTRDRGCRRGTSAPAAERRGSRAVGRSRGRADRPHP